jgi:hypothetical protein
MKAIVELFQGLAFLFEWLGVEVGDCDIARRQILRRIF